MRQIKRTPTESLATTQLRNAILSGSLAPGARLRQEDLAARLGVSRMPVRQALSVLEREGLVRTDPWRRTIVAPLDRELIADSYAFRAIVERYVAETLAQRPSFDTAALHAIIASARNAASDDLVHIIDLDLRFHARLYELMDNRVLSDVMKGQWAHMRRVMAVTLTISASFRQRVWDEHADIVEAIEAGDVTRAGAAAQLHIERASVTVLEHVDELASRDAAPLGVGLKVARP